MEKSDNIQIKIQPELKEKFFHHCHENAINPSEFIRKKITEFVKQQEKQAE